MARYAVVRDADSVVINLVVWDGVSQWSPPEGTTAVLDATGEDQRAMIGGTYDSEIGFSPPE